MHRLLSLVMVIASSGCAPAPHPLSEMGTTQVALADGGTTALADLLGRSGTVLVSLDPECPLSRLYRNTLDSLSGHFASQGVRFIGLHSSPFMDREALVRSITAMGLSFPQVVDGDCSLTQHLGATVIPEAFVLDGSSRLLYHGAIDDRAVRAGRKKPKATRHYLADALHAIAKGSPNERTSVPAVGCIVECTP